jgi:hypothetical protein
MLAFFGCDARRALREAPTTDTLPVHAADILAHRIRMTG